MQTRAVALRLCHAVKATMLKSPELRTLALPGVRLPARGVTKIAQALHHCQQLRRLDLSNTAMGDAGFATIADALRISECINFLLCGKCNLTWRSTKALMAIFKQHAAARDEELWARGLRAEDDHTAVATTGLLCVDLADNELGDMFATAFGNWLSFDRWLQAVRVARNGLSAGAAKVLLDGLLGNEHMCVLDVRDNPSADDGTLVAIERVCASRRVPPPDANAMLWRDLIKWGWPFLDVSPVKSARASARRAKPGRKSTAAKRVALARKSHTTARGSAHDGLGAGAGAGATAAGVAAGVEDRDETARVLELLDRSTASDGILSPPAPHLMPPRRAGSPQAGGRNPWDDPEATAVEVCVGAVGVVGVVGVVPFHRLPLPSAEGNRVEGCAVHG